MAPSKAESKKQSLALLQETAATFFKPRSGEAPTTPVDDKLVAEGTVQPGDTTIKIDELEPGPQQQDTELDVLIGEFGSVVIDASDMSALQDKLATLNKVTSQAREKALNHKEETEHDESATAEEEDEHTARICTIKELR